MRQQWHHPEYGKYRAVSGLPKLSGYWKQIQKLPYFWKSWKLQILWPPCYWKKLPERLLSVSPHIISGRYRWYYQHHRNEGYPAWFSYMVKIWRNECQVLRDPLPWWQSEWHFHRLRELPRSSAGCYQLQSQIQSEPAASFHGKASWLYLCRRQARWYGSGGCPDLPL